MSEAVLVALISGLMSLAGVVITGLITARRSERTAAVARAVTETRLEELTREVRAHNHFAQRMPVVEEKLRVLGHRIGDLEAYNKTKQEVHYV